jgi:hypothetical protein
MTGGDSGLYSRMGTHRFVIGLISLVGVIGVLVGAFVDGFGGDTAIWILAFGLGIGFWWLAGQFLAAPSDVALKTLTYPFYGFIFCWILGAVTSFIVWGEIDVMTALGVLLGLVATFFMREFIVAGTSLLRSRGQL